MTNEEIIEKIRTTLAEEFEVDIDVIQPDAPLMETLELDSLDLVDMVVLVEKNFGFNVTGRSDKSDNRLFLNLHTDTLQCMKISIPKVHITRIYFHCIHILI